MPKAWKIPFTAEQMERMKSMYVEEKQTCHYIGGVYGISHSAVLARLVDMGVEIRNQGKLRIYTDDQVHEISQLRAQGHTWAYVIDVVGGGCEPHMRKRVLELDTMGYYNEEKVLYFANMEKRLHVAPDEKSRNTTLYGLVTDLVKRGLLEEHTSKGRHRWYRTTKAGDIRLLQLQIEWREDRDKSTKEQKVRLAELLGEQHAQ